MHSDGAVTQHGLRTRGGDGDVVARFPLGGIARFVVRYRKLISLAVLNRIFEVPEVAVHFLVLDFEIGDRRFEVRVPVHEALVFVDQAFLVQLHEDLQHRSREAIIHREAFARPIA